MSQNNYEGVLEKWKVGLMIRRAVRLGFNNDALDDVLQDLAIQIMGYTFDPSRTRLSKESDLAIFIDHFLKNRLRSEKRRRSREENEAQERDRNKVDYQTEINMQQDAEYAIFAERLSDFHREVFKYLREGKSEKFIARKLNVRWHTVQNVVNRILEQLQECDLIPPGYFRNT